MDDSKDQDFKTADLNKLYDSIQKGGRKKSIVVSGWGCLLLALCAVACLLGLYFVLAVPEYRVFGGILIGMSLAGLLLIGVTAVVRGTKAAKSSEPS